MTPPGKLDWIHACWAGVDRFDATLFARRCREHHHRVVETARALGRRLLLLPTDGSDAEKWRAAAAESPGAPGAAVVLRRAAVVPERAAAAVPLAVAGPGL